MNTPRILRMVDEFARPIVRVEMSNLPNVFATLDAADYDRLLSEGVSQRWFINSNGTGASYVRAADANAKGGLVLIARLVLAAGRGQVVHYASLDRLDLRRKSISLKGGAAKGRALTPMEVEAALSL